MSLEDLDSRAFLSPGLYGAVIRLAACSRAYSAAAGQVVGAVVIYYLWRS